MIGHINGEIIAKLDTTVIVSLGNGIGYEVLPSYEVNLGDTVSFYIHTSVKEQDISLFGFKSIEELDIFRLLISVSGVGVKSAMQLIRERGPRDIVSSISSKDEKMIKVKGLGAKTIQKIFIELGSKLDKFANISTPSGGKLSTDAYGDLSSALLALGYDEKSISESIRSMANDEEIDISTLSLQDKIKRALKYIA